MVEDANKVLVPAQPQKLSTIEIRKHGRVACTIGGVLVLGFAGVLTWRGVDGAATVAFVALAAVFLLLAIAGVVPRRIKIGENEADLTRDEAQQAAVETTDAAIDTMSRKEIESFIDNTLRTAQSGDPLGSKFAAAARAREAADFEASVISFFADRVGPHQEEIPPVDHPYDLILKAKTGTVYVAVKWSLTAHTFRDLVKFDQNNPSTVRWIILPTLAHAPIENMRKVVTQHSSEIPAFVCTGSNLETLESVYQRFMVGDRKLFSDSELLTNFDLNRA